MQSLRYPPLFSCTPGIMLTMMLRLSVAAPSGNGGEPRRPPAARLRRDPLRSDAQPLCSVCLQRAADGVRGGLRQAGVGQTDKRAQAVRLAAPVAGQPREHCISLLSAHHRALHRSMRIVPG
jgi:hypothetical protein